MYRKQSGTRDSTMNDRGWRHELAMLTYIRDHTAYPIGNVSLLHLPDNDVAIVFDWLGADWKELSIFAEELDANELADLTAELFSAVALLHSAEVYHRDIKPENILFNRVVGKARLIDFGLACRARNNLVGCSSDEWLGTADYIPPRLLRQGVQHDTETASLQDRWGAAATMYYIVVGVEIYGAMDVDPYTEAEKVSGSILHKALAHRRWVAWRGQAPGPARVVEDVLWEGI